MKYFNSIVFAIILIIGGLSNQFHEVIPTNSAIIPDTVAVVENLGELPVYSGHPYVVVNNNHPDFPVEWENSGTFATYSELDGFGRCGPAYGVLGIDLMPTEARKPIGMVKPSGWQTVRYDNLIEDKYLYNRCHLIGFQLTGENANPKNLITGTRYLNVEGMLPFENKVADYIRKTKNRVMYRVTPLFLDNELVARGVKMDARSIEDGGKGIEFSVYIFNVQPRIKIDYATGESKPLK